MALDSLAGQLVPKERLADIPALIKAYHELAPDPEVSAQGISFGTSGHRGCALTRSFNRNHIL
ncbi:MAG: alpha-D-glucose phosphate-specific phosphoglucomutase, partial [Halieaceae bacterium]|nr:alpha-D-glucose phosphate-specific phosphoglucomutase [Halieaceae bacterium]